MVGIAGKLSYVYGYIYSFSSLTSFIFCLHLSTYVKIINMHMLLLSTPVIIQTEYGVKNDSSWRNIQWKTNFFAVLTETRVLVPPVYRRMPSK